MKQIFFLLFFSVIISPISVSGEFNKCIAESGIVHDIGKVPEVGELKIENYNDRNNSQNESDYTSELETSLDKKNENSNIKNDSKKTPLMIASLNGNLEIVKSLISEGADVNAKDNYGFTALMHAVVGGSLEIVKLLVSAGADINATVYNTSPLLIAYQMGHDEIVEYLIASGAEEPAGYHVAPMTKEEIKEAIQSVWSNFRNALIDKDIETALSYIAYQSKDMYRYNFELLKEHLSEIGNNLSKNIFIDKINDGIAECHMLSVSPEDGLKYNHYVQFYREHDGIWRIVFF
jgi:ankyrin repeat protein